MERIRLGAAALLTALALILAGCGGGGTGGGPDGGFSREDPTLNQEGDVDQGNSGQSNQTTDNGSGTGAGRGDG